MKNIRQSFRGNPFTPATISVVALVFGTAAISIRADVVLDWNQIAADTILAPGARPAASGILDFAVVQATIHDAVQAYQKRFETYAIDISGATGSMDAAVATAAHDVLVNRFTSPAQVMALDNAYSTFLGAHGLTTSDPGVSVGQQVAAAMI